MSFDGSGAHAAGGCGAVQIDQLADLISLTDAAKLLPRRPHRNTLHRWTTLGCRGAILRTRLIGRDRYTSRQWLAEFLNGISGRAPATTVVNSGAAEQSLAAAGW